MQMFFHFANTFLVPAFSDAGGMTKTHERNMKPLTNSLLQRPDKIERGSSGGAFAKRPVSPIKPSRPNPRRIALAVAPIMRGVSSQRVHSLEQIVKLAGEKPDSWTKPEFGSFDYWLAHNCKWISDAELQSDNDAYEDRRRRALQTSHRFSVNRFTWAETPNHEEPEDSGEYVPQIGMKMVKDRNLTDSSRRIAMFVLRHTYQDNREGRFIGMTVSFIMKGLELSRRTVQRSLTLLETRGYFRCEVAKGPESRMCIGLIIHLLTPLFPNHHRERWLESRRKPEASSMPQKHPRYKSFSDTVCETPLRNRVSRMNWALRCMDGVGRAASKYFRWSSLDNDNQTEFHPYRPNSSVQRVSMGDRKKEVLKRNRTLQPA
jgi:hypothetical protein